MILFGQVMQIIGTSVVYYAMKFCVTQDSSKIFIFPSIDKLMIDNINNV